MFEGFSVLFSTFSFFLSTSACVSSLVQATTTTRATAVRAVRLLLSVIVRRPRWTHPRTVFCCCVVCEGFSFNVKCYVLSCHTDRNLYVPFESSRKYLPPASTPRSTPPTCHHNPLGLRHSLLPLEISKNQFF